VSDVCSITADDLTNQNDQRPVTAFFAIPRRLNGCHVSDPPLGPHITNCITLLHGSIELFFFLDYDMIFTQCYSSRLTISHTTDVHDHLNYLAEAEQCVLFLVFFQLRVLETEAWNGGIYVDVAFSSCPRKTIVLLSLIFSITIVLLA
jgi:hypothetical protein